MDPEIIKIVGAIAGIGGISLAVLFYTFREIIRKQIFPQLTNRHAYKLLNLIVVLTFVIGVLGLLAYVVLNWRSTSPVINNPERSASGPTQTKAELSGTVLDQHGRPLQGAKVTLDDVPGMLSVETSSDGIFNLKEIAKAYGDGVRIRVVKEGYSPNPYTEDIVLGKMPPRIVLTKR